METTNSQPTQISLSTGIDSEEVEDAPTDAVFKFINGEITFNDYLNQMDEFEEGENKEYIDDSILLNSSRPDEDDKVSDISELSDISWSGSHSGSEEDTVEQKTEKKKQKRKVRCKRSKLSPALRALMGQANVCYAKGDTQTAVKMCLEIIKEAPKASEPFKTLASIYEEMGEQEKSHQMRLIAAHLGPATKDEWIELAQLLKNKNQFRQAVVCYTRAINTDPLNLTLYEERAEIMKRNNVACVEGYGYLRLLYKLNPETEGLTLLYLCKKLAKIYYNEKKFDKSCKILKYAFDRCPSLITLAEANIYLDVLVTLQDFSQCLYILTTYCNIEVNQTTLNGCMCIGSCTVPDDLPIDIRAKLILTLIYYSSFEYAKSQIEVLLQQNPNDIGDLFLDVGTMLSEKEQYEEAAKVLSPLIDTENFNSVNLWLKLAHCYKKLDQIQKCYQCYQKALEYFPADEDLKLKFCSELKSAQLYREAIEVTLLDKNISVLALERCKMYLLLNEHDNFLEAGWQLFRLHCKKIVTHEDYVLFSSILHLQKGTSGILSQYVPSTIDDSVSVEEEWEIFLTMCKLYIERKEFDLLQTLTSSLYLSFKFVSKRKELRMAIMIACLMNNDCELGFDLAREIIHQGKICSQRIWNILNICSFRAEYSRIHKFLIRYLKKHPNEDRAVMLYANNCFLAGTYKYALNDYALLYEKYKTPLLALLVALNMMFISCQKYSTNKHALMLQVIAFLAKYENLRGFEAAQEVNYNIGRLFHQLEMLPQAIFYYKKALNSQSSILSDMFDLKCDIAYNLHLIYLNSGQPLIANMYLQKYIVI